MFLQQLVNGLTLGSLYAVLAIGLTLVFGVLNIINMAHGGIFMIGAFVGLFMVTVFDVNIFVALIVAMRYPRLSSRICGPSSTTQEKGVSLGTTYQYHRCFYLY